MAKILLVEDDPMLRDFYADLLVGEGYTVDRAPDGEEGLQHAKHGGYDLVLLDVNLPKRDGIGILKELKTNPPQTPNKKICMLTNASLEENVSSELAALDVPKCLLKSTLTPEQFVKEIKILLS